MHFTRTTAVLAGLLVFVAAPTSASAAGHLVQPTGAAAAAELALSKDDAKRAALVQRSPQGGPPEDAPAGYGAGRA